MKTPILCFLLVVLVSRIGFSQKTAINLDQNFGLHPKTENYGGFVIFPKWMDSRYRKSPVQYKDAPKWLKKYPRTLIRGYRKKLVLIEQGTVIYNEAYTGAYSTSNVAPKIPQVIGFSSGKVKPTSLVFSLFAAHEKDLESVYYRMAVESKFSEHLTLDEILLYCNSYLSKFPNGKPEYYRMVKKRSDEIAEIPSEIRRLQHNELVSEAKRKRDEQYKKDLKASENFWNGVYRFLNAPASSDGVGNSGSDKVKCSACSGRGYVYSGDNRRESCYVCGGSGSN